MTYRSSSHLLQPRSLWLNSSSCHRIKTPQTERVGLLEDNNFLIINASHKKYVLEIQTSKKPRIKNSPIKENSTTMQLWHCSQPLSSILLTAAELSPERPVNCKTMSSFNPKDNCEIKIIHLYLLFQFLSWWIKILRLSILDLSTTEVTKRICKLKRI